jgi:hypothetical protein
MTGMHPLKRAVIDAIDTDAYWHFSAIWPLFQASTSHPTNSGAEYVAAFLERQGLR